MHDLPVMRNTNDPFAKKDEATCSHAVISKASWFCQPHLYMWITKTPSLQSEMDSDLPLLDQTSTNSADHSPFNHNKRTQERPKRDPEPDVPQD